MCVLVKLPHDDPRTSYLSAKSGAAGHTMIWRRLLVCGDSTIGDLQHKSGFSRFFNKISIVIGEKRNR
jgi:hypothetical protein